MNPYVFENPPLANTEEGRILTEYLARQFSLLRDSIESTQETVLENFVLAGYGGLGLSASRLGSDIGLTWQTITGYDQVVTNTPRYVVQDLTNSGLVLDIDGMWLISVYFAISHNEVNAGREMLFRFYNADLAVGSRELVVGTGRNVGVTNFSASFLSEVDQVAINDLWQIQVRSDDTYTSVTWEDQEFSVTHVGEYSIPYTG